MVDSGVLLYVDCRIRPNLNSGSWKIRIGRDAASVHSADLIRLYTSVGQYGEMPLSYVKIYRPFWTILQHCASITASHSMSSSVLDIDQGLRPDLPLDICPPYGFACFMLFEAIKNQIKRILLMSRLSIKIQSRISTRSYQI